LRRWAAQGPPIVVCDWSLCAHCQDVVDFIGGFRCYHLSVLVITPLVVIVMIARRFGGGLSCLSIYLSIPLMLSPSIVLLIGYFIFITELVLKYRRKIDIIECALCT